MNTWRTRTLLLFCECFYDNRAVYKLKYIFENCWRVSLQECECNAVENVNYFYWSVNAWCWASSLIFLTFPFMTSTLHGLLLYWAAYIHTKQHTGHTHGKPGNISSLVVCNHAKSTASMSYGGKKEIKATSCFCVFQMLCFSLYYFVLFLVFPHPVPHSSPRIR